MTRAAFALLVLALGCGKREEKVATPGPPATNACGTCHAAIAAEWNGSFHHTSATDRTYQASLAHEEPKDRAFCTGCHAPRGEAAGIDCVTCHGASFEAPHARVAMPTAACASCHEFAFEGRTELVQKTASEHAASAFASVPCADCHMPVRDGHRDHRFLAGHAPETVARSVHVEAAREGEAAVRVAIRSDAGHAFPTGDMFRRVRLEVFAEGARGEIVGSAERVFERTWSSVPQTAARTQASDTRIRGEWQSVLPLEPTAPIARVRWRLHYERVVATRGPYATLASSDVLREGELAW